MCKKNCQRKISRRAGVQVTLYLERTNDSNFVPFVLLITHAREQILISKKTRSILAYEYYLSQKRNFFLDLTVSQKQN